MSKMFKKLQNHVSESDNDIITEISNSIIQEAISHFNQSRVRARLDDERYFYKWEEIEAILSNLKDPDSVSITQDLNSDGSVFCYIMNYAVRAKETRAR